MSEYTSEVQHIYRIGYVTAHKERDYDPLGNEEVCNYIEQFNKTYTEAEHEKIVQEKLRQQRVVCANEFERTYEDIFTTTLRAILNAKIDD